MVATVARADTMHSSSVCAQLKTTALTKSAIESCSAIETCSNAAAMGIPMLGGIIISGGRSEAGYKHGFEKMRRTQDTLRSCFSRVKEAGVIKTRRNITAGITGYVILAK